MAHCDCLLFCALEILLLTYLLTSMSRFWILLELRMMVTVTIGTVRYAKLLSNRHH